MSFLRALILRALLRKLARRREDPPAVAARRDRRRPDEDGEREVGARPGAELQVAALLVLAGLLGIAFVATYVIEPDTQLLGLALGLALAIVAVAMVRAANAVVRLDGGRAYPHRTGR